MAYKSHWTNMNEKIKEKNKRDEIMLTSYNAEGEMRIAMLLVYGLCFSLFLRRRLICLPHKIAAWMTKIRNTKFPNQNQNKPMCSPVWLQRMRAGGSGIPALSTSCSQPGYAQHPGKGTSAGVINKLQLQSCSGDLRFQWLFKAVRCRREPFWILNFVNYGMITYYLLHPVTELTVKGLNLSPCELSGSVIVYALTHLCAIHSSRKFDTIFLGLDLHFLSFS